jgi:hypothetical protein
MKVRIFVFFIIAALALVQCHRKTIPSAGKPVKPAEKPAVKSPSPTRYENFEAFYQRFLTDSLFQISRVNFPLKGQQIHIRGASAWKKEKWMMIKAKASEVDKTLYNIKTVRKDNSYFEGIYCKNCGFSFETEYRLINGKWFLVYLQERDE